MTDCMLSDLRLAKSGDREAAERLGHAARGKPEHQRNQRHHAKGDQQHHSARPVNPRADLRNRAIRHQIFNLLGLRRHPVNGNEIVFPVPAQAR